MRTTTIFFAIIFSVVFSNNSIAGNNLARIKDQDGFTNVRDSASSKSKVVGILQEDDLFYCRELSSDWWHIAALKKDNGGRQLVGYVHSSRIQLIDSLDSLTKRELFTNILSEHNRLATEFHASLSLDARKALENNSDEKYSPILSNLSRYFCQSSDSVLLQLFFSTIIADYGSANEMPSFSLGECYVCHPALVLRQVQLISNSEDRKLIFADIEWGLMAYFDVPEDGKSTNKEYLRLKKQLDKAN